MPVKKIRDICFEKNDHSKIALFCIAWSWEKQRSKLYISQFLSSPLSWDNLTGIFPCHKLHDVFTEVSEWTHVLLNITLRSMYAQGLEYRYWRQSVQFFPIQTDLGWWKTFFFNLLIFFYYLNSTKCFPEEPLWFKAVITARSSMNWTIFERVNGSRNTLSQCKLNRGFTEIFFLCNGKGDLKGFQNSFKTLFLKVSVTIWYLSIKERVRKKAHARFKTLALVWQTKLSSMSVTIIFSLKTVNDLTESVTHFHRLLMNEV